MKASVSELRSSGSRIAARVGIAAASLMTMVAVIAAVAGFRINTTPSVALGLWRIVPLNQPAALGDLLFVCPPATSRFAEARKRGYLHSGMCPGRYAPLIKTIIAIEGQVIEIRDNIRVDGREVPNSRLVDKDGDGRPLVPYRGGTVAVGEVFLHSAYPGSWDSRYFGPIPGAGILGLAQEVLTYAP